MGSLEEQWNLPDMLNTLNRGLASEFPSMRGGMTPTIGRFSDLATLFTPREGFDAAEEIFAQHRDSSGSGGVDHQRSMWSGLAASSERRGLLSQGGGAAAPQRESVDGALYSVGNTLLFRTSVEGASTHGGGTAQAAHHNPEDVPLASSSGAVEELPTETPVEDNSAAAQENEAARELAKSLQLSN